MMLYVNGNMGTWEYHHRLHEFLLSSYDISTIDGCGLQERAIQGDDSKPAGAGKIVDPAD